MKLKLRLGNRFYPSIIPLVFSSNFQQPPANRQYKRRFILGKCPQKITKLSFINSPSMNIGHLCPSSILPRTC